MRLLSDLANLVEVKATRVERRYLLPTRLANHFELLSITNYQLFDFQTFAFKRWGRVHIDSELAALGEQLDILPKLVQRPFVIG